MKNNTTSSFGSKRPPVTVIKVGGAVVESPESLATLLDAFATVDGAKVLVHGGGRSATALARRLNLEVTMIDGRRVTDRDMLDVVTMTYAGLVNKNIVAALQARGTNALGLCGADLSLIVADRRPPHPVDYGYVGDVRHVDGHMLSSLLGLGIVPVVAPLSYDGAGTLLNTNADTIAAEVAAALVDDYDVTLTYCFELPGVMTDINDPASVIARITPDTYHAMCESGIISGGMIPKLDNAFHALERGISQVVITCPTNLAGGTKIVPA